MSFLFESNEIDKPKESSKIKNNIKIDINKELEEENNNINYNNMQYITTERKQLDSKKEQKITNYNDNETNVDMNSMEGEENIDIKNIHNFKNHLSELKTIFNSKADTTISKEIKLSKNTENQKEAENIENKEIKKNIKIDIDNNIYNINTEDIPNDNAIINHINGFEFNNIFNDVMDSIEYKKQFFNEIMFYKKCEFNKKYELSQRNDIYRTTVIYNKKESILLINKDYLYILEIKSNILNLNNNEKNNDNNTTKLNNENNPDLSLLYNLEKQESNSKINKSDNNINNHSAQNINIKKLKTDYELSHPVICINFNLLSCRLLLNKNDINNKNKNSYELQIKILGSTEVIISFYFQIYEVYEKFSYIIGQKIFNSEGYKTNKMGLCLRNNNFYKDTYMTTSEFEKITKTGDMLLFETLDCISDVQRFFTRDKYDHIALIIRNNDEIEILEATSNEKCSLLKWKRFKFYFYNLIFKKVVLRRLNIEEKDPLKEDEIRKNIDEKSKIFIEKIHKKEYEMSLLKMAFSRKPETYEINNEWEKGTGYCCSALNAAFYIYNGIMKLDKSVHSVRPGDFEQDKNRLTMMPGFSFGPEKIIEFST